MKLRTRMTLQVGAVILSAIIILSIGMMIVFSSTFENYLRNFQSEKMHSIITDLSEIIREENIDLASSEFHDRLDYYARDTNINISILDRSSRIVATYSGLKKQTSPAIRIEEYQLIDSQRNPLGSMLVTYDSQDPEVEVAVNTFRAKSLGSMVALLLGYAILSGVLGYSMSRTVTTPIESLTKKTNELRKKNYKTTFDSSNITEIQELSANLQFLANTLDQQEEARQNYAQDISHELRTPLTNLQLHLDAMEDGVIATDQDSIQSLRSNVNQLTSIVERLRSTFADASMISNAKWENANLSMLLNEWIDGFEPMIAKKNASFQRVIEKNVNLKTDPKLVRLVVSNLISNAIKAIDTKGIVRVILTHTRNEVLLTVADNGVGLSSDEIKHLFDRFYRVDSSRNRQLGGQGLGLAITRNIVTQLGGRIHVTSRVGKGATFRVSLPTRLFSDQRDTN